MKSLSDNEINILGKIIALVFVAWVIYETFFNTSSIRNIPNETTNNIREEGQCTWGSDCW